VDDGEGSAGPGEPKIATVERREASVPRHGTHGASQAPGVPRYVHAHGCSAEHPNVSRRSAHPSTGVSEAKRQSPDAAMRARERDGLFDIVKIGASDGRPHSEERSCRPLKRCLERGDRSLVHAQLYKRHLRTGSFGRCRSGGDVLSHNGLSNGLSLEPFDMTG
jgi:hypothetical protein